MRCEPWSNHAAEMDVRMVTVGIETDIGPRLAMSLTVQHNRSLRSPLAPNKKPGLYRLSHPKKSKNHDGSPERGAGRGAADGTPVGVGGAGAADGRTVPILYSLGNLVFVSDLRKEYDSRAIRLGIVAHHYRTAWEWSDDIMPTAAARLER